MPRTREQLNRSMKTPCRQDRWRSIRYEVAQAAPDEPRSAIVTIVGLQARTVCRKFRSAQVSSGASSHDTPSSLTMDSQADCQPSPQTFSSLTESDGILLIYISSLQVGQWGVCWTVLCLVKRSIHDDLSLNLLYRVLHTVSYIYTVCLTALYNMTESSNDLESI